MDEEKRTQLVGQIISKIDEVVDMLQRYSILEAIFSFDQDILINAIIDVYKNENEESIRKKISHIAKNIENCPKFIGKLTALRKQLDSGQKTQEFSFQYLKLIDSAVSFPKADTFYDWLKSTPSLNCIFEDSADPAEKQRTVNNFYPLLNNSFNFSPSFNSKLEQLELFKSFSGSAHSVVIIGANGSGKSSFSRTIKKTLSVNNIAVISAQKIFIYNTVKNIPTGNENLFLLHQFQAEEKLGKESTRDSIRAYISQRATERLTYVKDLGNLVLALLEEHHHLADEFYQSCNENLATKRKTSKLEEVMQFWGEIITHRHMEYKTPNITIFSHDENIRPYDFIALSDGEKAVFYYVAHILLAPEDSFIIIDEPEGHLHVGVVSKLWDKLELLREDCKFIYLTHDLNFASSRSKADKLWSKSFTPPANWDIVPLPQDENLPESLLMEILGSRKKILFCEGEKSSLDYKLYSLLFPQYTIQPVGGHLDVINYTRAFNKSHVIFDNTAVGIIDGDFHFDKAKSKWESDLIFCLDVQEVENLLCDEDLLLASTKRFCAEDNALEDAKKGFFEKLEVDKEAQALEYAIQYVNNMLKSSFMEKPKTKEDLQNQLKEKVIIDIENIIKKRTLLFDQIVQDKDFNRGVKKYNNKGLVGMLGDKIVGRYKERIFGLLESDTEVLEKFRKKYFSMIPEN